MQRSHKPPIPPPYPFTHLHLVHMGAHLPTDLYGKSMETKLLAGILVYEIKKMYLCNINDSTMEAAINRKSTMFRLREELIDRLKQLAARDNRSLNNYVETILMDVAYNTPNATTRAAMAEAANDENLTDVDMSSYDSFLKSLDLK